ncbi:hypothetical protein PCURB6_37720 [Paenibacillus curdlanolyticus]|nr:hypothetical protein PCURB6_37720 [Paenibacillus curdlanolyticus]
MLVHADNPFNGLWTGLPTISIVKDFLCVNSYMTDSYEDSKNINATLVTVYIIVFKYHLFQLLIINYHCINESIS